MTANQIAFWNLQEVRRNNIATLNEQKRHNVSGEAETTRHNVATEVETNRSNVAKEDYNNRNLLELTRHNQATETETHRSNTAQEQLKFQANEIQRGQAEETARHNKEQERISLMNLAENERANKAAEALGYQRNVESTRSNMAEEALSAQRNYETARSNQAQEALSAERNELQEIQQNRNFIVANSQMNLEREKLAETAKHNRATETTQKVSTAIDAGKSILQSVTQVLLKKGAR